MFEMSNGFSPQHNHPSFSSVSVELMVVEDREADEKAAVGRYEAAREVAATIREEEARAASYARLEAALKSL